MTQIENEPEEPLDPAIENIRRRMIRLLVISIGIMMVGLMAVLFAIVYKINTGEDSADEASQAEIPGEVETSFSKRGKSRAKFMADINVDIPDGATIASSNLRGRRLVLELEMPNGGFQLWVVNMVSGEVESRVTIR